MTVANRFKTDEYRQDYIKHHTNIGDNNAPFANSSKTLALVNMTAHRKKLPVFTTIYAERINTSVRASKAVTLLLLQIVVLTPHS